MWPPLHSLLLALHVLAVVFWIGGMMFAHLVLRPASADLSAPERLGLWAGVFGRFLPRVWHVVATILLTGFAMLLPHDLAHAPRAWHVMALLGLVMVGIFASVWFGPYRQFKQAAAQADWPAAGAALARIRPRVAANLALGVLTIVVATAGVGLF